MGPVYESERNRWKGEKGRIDAVRIFVLIKDNSIGRVRSKVKTGMQDGRQMGKTGEIDARIEAGTDSQTGTDIHIHENIDTQTD